MALNIPNSSEEVEQRAKTDVSRAWTGSNPFLKNSAIAALIIGYANRVYDFYLQLKEAIRQSFPDTSTDEFLERWGSIYGVDRLAATKSSGLVAFSGVDGTPIPNGTVFSSSDGVLFVATQDGEIGDINIQGAVNGLTRIGSVATFTTVFGHGLSSSITVSITGAIEPEYNVTDTAIIVTSATTFTYEVTGTPTTPATGVTFAAYNATLGPGVQLGLAVESVDVQNTETGNDVNLGLDTPIALQSPIIGVDSPGNVGFGGLSGGVDQETDALLRVRLLDRIQNPVANYNVAAIRKQAFLINGVTRVFVQEITPDVGDVTVYFLRDNDPVPIPDAPEIADVRASINIIRPASSAEVNLFVLAPTQLDVNFTLDTLTPNTLAMQQAITANLEQFFREETDVGVLIPREKYLTAIQNTIDSGGNTPVTFNVTAPAGDIAVASGQLAFLGTVTYP